LGRGPLPHPSCDVKDLGVGRLDTDVAAVRATSPAIGNGPKFGGASGHLVKAAMQVGDEVDGTPGIGKLAKTSCRHAPDAVNGLMKDQQFFVAEHAGTTCRKPHSSRAFRASTISVPIQEGAASGTALATSRVLARNSAW